MNYYLYGKCKYCTLDNTIPKTHGRLNRAMTCINCGKNNNNSDGMKLKKIASFSKSKLEDPIERLLLQIIVNEILYK